MRVYYRISDQSYPKQKLPGADKFKCLDNFISQFQDHSTIIILADNCGEATIESLKSRSLFPRPSSLGNAGSFRQSVLDAISFCDPSELVYLVEDDYLHRDGAATALLDAANAGIADYWTLYDHPDKYSAEYQFGEVSKVVKVREQHWRYTQSTTMTFATHAATLKQDIDTWMKYTDGYHPKDHLAFSDLTSQGRRLAVAIPGLSCHVDMTWNLTRRTNTIASWVLGLLSRQ